MMVRRPLVVTWHIVYVTQGCSVEQPRKGRKRWCISPPKMQVWIVNFLHTWDVVLETYIAHIACLFPEKEFDRYELQIYEEVARMPPFQRKTLILIGAQGVGRRSLKNRLILLTPLQYGTTVPCECVASRQRCNIGCMFLGIYVFLLHFYLQSHHAVPEKRRGMVRTTVLWHGKRWRKTSRRAVTWSTASMMATFMAPRSTQSTKSWIPAVPAFLTSTLRLVAG